MGDRKRPVSRDHDVEKALRYWQPMYDLDGDIESQLLELFPDDMVDSDTLDDHMVGALSQLAAANSSLRQSLHLLEVNRSERLLKYPADEAKHITQEDVENAIVYFDTINRVKTLWEVNSPDEIFEPIMRPDITDPDFIPWFSCLVTPLKVICVLVEEGLCIESVSNQILQEWTSSPRDVVGADGVVRTVCMSKLDLEHALQELKKTHRQNEARLLTRATSHPQSVDLQRDRSVASSASTSVYSPTRAKGRVPSVRSDESQGHMSQESGNTIHRTKTSQSPRQTLRAAFVRDVLNPEQHEQDRGESSVHGWDDTTFTELAAETAATGHIFHNDIMAAELRDKTIPLSQQCSRDMTPSQDSYNDTEDVEDGPYPLVTAEFRRDMKERMPWLPMFRKKARKVLPDAASLHDRGFQTPTRNVPGDIESLHSSPQSLRDREASNSQQRHAIVDVSEIENLLHTPQRLRDCSIDNGLPRESPVVDAPANFGNLTQLQPVAREIDGSGAVQGHMTNMQLHRAPFVQQEPVRLAARHAAPPAPLSKAKSRVASRHTSRHTPYGRAGHSRGRRPRRSHEFQPEVAPEAESINDFMAEIAKGVTIEVFGGPRHIPDNLAPARKLQLLAKQKSMLLRTRNMYALGKEEYEAEELSKKRKFLAAQRIEFTEGLHDGLEFDEILVEAEGEVEMEDA